MADRGKGLNWDKQKGSRLIVAHLNVHEFGKSDVIDLSWDSGSVKTEIWFR